MIKPIKFNTKQELYDFLRNYDYSQKQDTELSSVYFLIKYKYKDNDKEFIEPIYFTSFQDVFFPSPCDVHQYPMNDNELDDYVKELYEEEYYEKALEFEKMMQRNNIHYEIDCPQVSPFLPEEVILLDVLSETECLDYILKQEKMHEEDIEK